MSRQALNCQAMPQPSKISAESVLQGALTILESGGLTSVTLRGVAAKLGVTPNALYWHYRSREALLSALAAHGMAELQRQQARAASPSPDDLWFHDVQPSDLLDILPVCQAYLDFARQRPHLYTLIMTPPADPVLSGELWRFTNALLTPYVGPQRAASVGVAVWAYLHGVASLTALDPFYDGKPHQGLTAGLRALLGGLSAGLDDEEIKQN